MNLHMGSSATLRIDCEKVYLLPTVTNINLAHDKETLLLQPKAYNFLGRVQLVFIPLPISIHYGKARFIKVKPF
jgi:hypothetical protein